MMKNKLLLRRIGAWLLIVLFLLPGNIYAEESEMPEQSDFVNPDYEYYLSRPEEFKYGYVPPKAKFQLEEGEDLPARVLPSSYDARSIGRISPVKSQGETGTCWAHASSSSVETAWKIRRGEFPDLSEMHMAYNSSPGTDLDSGGNPLIAMGYYARTDGPVYESDYSSASEARSGASGWILPGRTKMEDHGKRNGKFSVGEMIAVSYPQIKEYVMDYGMVIASYHVADGSDYYTHSDPFNQPGLGYHLPDNLISNHAISIVGWDDNRTVRNLKGQEGRGAFLVKNSWGEHFGENGYLWITYDSFRKREEAYVFTDVGAKRHGVYHAEPYEWQGESLNGFCYRSLYIINEYRRTGGSEEVAEVGFYKSDDKPIRYTFWLGEPSANDPNTFDFQEVGSETVSRGGYFTVPIRNVALTGERFAVKVKAEPIRSNDYICFPSVTESYSGAGFVKTLYSENDSNYRAAEGRHVAILTVYTNPAAENAKDIVKAVAAPIPSQNYIGAEIRPKVHLTHEGVTLRESEDYTLRYENNVEAGLGRILIRGVGAYRGEKRVSFPIRNMGFTYRGWSTKYSQPSNKEWRIQLNQPIDPFSLKPRNVFIVHESDSVNPVSVRLSLSSDRRTVTVRPNNPYLPGGRYYLLIRDLRMPTGQKMKQNIRMLFIVQQ